MWWAAAAWCRRATPPVRRLGGPGPPWPALAWRLPWVDETAVSSRAAWPAWHAASRKPPSPPAHPPNLLLHASPLAAYALPPPAGIDTFECVGTFSRKGHKFGAAPDLPVPAELAEAKEAADAAKAGKKSDKGAQLVGAWAWRGLARWSPAARAGAAPALRRRFRAASLARMPPTLWRRQGQGGGRGGGRPRQPLPRRRWRGAGHHGHLCRLRRPQRGHAPGRCVAAPAGGAGGRGQPPPLGRMLACQAMQLRVIQPPLLPPRPPCPSGAAVTKWGIEYERPASAAFKLNNPEVGVWGGGARGC